MRVRCTHCALGVGTAMIAAATAHAGIVGTTPSIEVLGDSPFDLTMGAFESTSEISVLREQQDLTLGGSLGVDLTGTGYFGSDQSQWTPGFIDAGTEVDVYLFHLDNIETETPVSELTGSITFDAPILGVVFRTDALRASDDMLGLSDVAYETTSNKRGMELWNGNDWIDISPDGLTVTVNMRVPSTQDQVRVITAAQPIPAPGALAALAGGLLLGRRRRRG